MKKIISLSLVCVLCLVCFASCGAHPASDALEELLKSVKTGDFASASVIENSPFANEDDEMLTAMYKNFDYTIGKTTETEDGANVEVSITMTDIGQVFTDYMTEAMENAMNSDWDADDTRFNEMLVSKDAPVKTFDITVAMVETDGAWDVSDSEANEGLVDALTGGLFSSLSGLLGE